MKKKILWLFLALIGAILLFVAFLFIEDSTYKKYEMDHQLKENRKVLIATWKTDDQTKFWETYSNEIQPTIKDLHQKKLVGAVFPLEHKSLNYKDSGLDWTNCIIIMPSENQFDSEIDSMLISTIEQSTIKNNFRALDLARVQNNLDMFYPKNNGIKREPKMKQTIEYLFSNPEARKKYYEDQYKFSGPAMKDLHSRDKAGRFVGFEIEKRITAKEDVPEWDLIHLIGFTTWQEIKAIPFFYGTWNKHAERAFGDGVTFKKKITEWNEIRTNVKSSTKQNFELTLRKN